MERTERRREVVRTEILETAWALARTGGVGAVTLKAVADEMGIKPPSLYEYIPNLHGLIDRMFRSGWEQYSEEVALLAASNASPRDWMRRVLTFCVEDPARFQLMMQRPVPGFIPSDESMQVAHRGYDVMRAAIAEFGFVTQDDVDLVDSMLLGLASNQVSNEPGGQHYLDLADRATDMLVDHVRRK